MASKSSKKKALQAARRSRHMAMVADRGGPTPETLAKLQPDALRTLLEAGKILEEQCQAAYEISSIYAAVVGSMWRRNSDYADNRGGSAGISAMMAWQHANRYLPWARALGGYRLPVVIDVVHDGRSIEEAARERRWSVEIVERVVISALADYADRIRTVRAPPKHELNP